MASTAPESGKCYKVDGNLQDAKYGWVPCNPDTPSGPCCSGVDYCLDNGLCLNAGVVNNLISVQGCTHPGWGGDCQKYCPGSMGTYALTRSVCCYQSDLVPMA